MIKWSDSDRGTFEKLCGIFCTKSEVCSIMGIADHRTLDRLIAQNYKGTPTWNEAFEHFSSKGKASLRRKQFEVAMSGDRVMLIFLGKNYLGQSDQGVKVDEQPTQRAKMAAFTSSSRFAKAANE